MVPFFIFTLLGGLALLGDLATPTPNDPVPLERQSERLPRQPYDIYRGRDPLGRELQIYLSESARTARLPLVVYVQGSSASSHFVRHGDRIRGATGHSSIADAFAGRAHVLLIEKPGVELFDDGRAPSDRFREEHTLERWCTALTSAIRGARELPHVATDRLLVIGHSEGGLVAAKLAADLPEVTHVAVLAGGGGVQLFDLLLLARRGTFFRHVSETDAAAREAYLLSEWSRVMAEPDRADRLFFGHSYRRWSSFHRTSPAQELRQTSAAIFIAQGERDEAVARESFDLLRAELLATGRAHEARLVAGADHSFQIAESEGPPPDGWGAILGEIRDWAWSTPR